MKTRTHVLVVLLTALLVTGAAVAAPQLDSLVAGNGLAFSTDFAYDKAFVRVTGPNAFVQDVGITEGGALSIAFDRALADGQYKWQLLMVEPISADVLAAMQDARRLGEKNLARKFNVVSHQFTGSFRVEAGALLQPSPASLLGDHDIPTKDQVFVDDVIIQFSLCVGNDCVNGESFGFDTMRLKENNLRIHFQDTSTTASFPSNDWRIVANDSANGGSNYLAIEDSNTGRQTFRVEAGARSNALYVENDSDVGLGTQNPVVNLHIVEGNTPTVRLEQDGSNGFTPQTWDLAGNEANFFLRDVTNGSELPIKVKPGADTSTLFLSADSNIGIGNESPHVPLHVLAGGSSYNPSNGSVNTVFQNNAATGDGSIIAIIAGTTGNSQIFFGDNDTSDDGERRGRVIYRNNSDAMSFWTAGTERLFIESDGQICIGCNNTTGDDLRHANGAHLTTGGAWTNGSSRELKQDIRSLEAAEAMETLAGLEPVSFRYKRQLDETYVGFIAEDVPDLVASGDRKGLGSMDIVGVLTKVVQEQQKAMETQQQTIDALVKRLEALENVD